MKDYYKILGIERNASKEDIKKAFRKLAHEHHPDKTKNDPASSQKFKEASEAYTILSDDAKRKHYDMFGSNGPGFNPGAGGYNGQGFGGFDFSGFQNGAGFDFSGFNRGANGGVEFDLGDIFGEFFGGQRRPRRGRSITVDVEISFKESIFGLEKDITIGKESLMVKIPPGIENNQGLRIREKGEEGPGGRGDLIVRVWVKEHPQYHKEGYNIITELDIKLTTALIGGSVELETLDGKIDLKIPAGTSHGELLRVKGKGVPYESSGIWSGHGKRGDLIIVTHVKMPKKLSKTAQKMIEELRNEGL